MQKPRHRFWPAVVAVLACALQCKSVPAQSQATGLQQPVGVVLQRGTGHAFFAEQGTARLLRWDGKTSDVLVENLKSEPALLDQIVALTLREENRLSLIGSSNGTPHLVTYSVNIDAPPELEAGLSGDLDLGGAESITGFTSTDVAIYVATASPDKNVLWQLAMGRTSFGKPKPIFTTQQEAITCLTISAQGHIAAVWQAPDRDAVLRFHHARTGQPLLSVPTDVREVTAISYSNSGLIYGCCGKGDRRGVYRFDVFFNGAKQAVRTFEIARLEQARGIACSNKQGSVVLVAGENDGRVLHLNLK